MSWKGFPDIRATIEIELDQTEEELWNNLDKDARWGVNRARKDGLKVQKCEDKKHWNDFYRIYKKTCKYGGINPISLEEVKIGELFACFYKQQLIAGAVVLSKGEVLTLFLNASEHEFLKHQPNNLLYWEIIVWAKKSKYKIFDLGGYQLNTRKGDKLYEINRFKRRWGGKLKKHKIYSKNPFYILGRKAIRNFRFFWWLNNKLRGRD